LRPDGNGEEWSQIIAFVSACNASAALRHNILLAISTKRLSAVVSGLTSDQAIPDQGHAF
jgi:hypothetical protein